MPQPQITPSLTFSDRTFSVPELHLIQTISADCAALGRTEIARTVCELLAWTRPRVIHRYPPSGWPMGRAPFTPLRSVSDPIPAN
jgi:hypothetical protein